MSAVWATSEEPALTCLSASLTWSMTCLAESIAWPAFFADSRAALMVKEATSLIWSAMACAFWAACCSDWANLPTFLTGEAPFLMA